MPSSSSAWPSSSPSLSGLPAPVLALVCAWLDAGDIAAVSRASRTCCVAVRALPALPHPKGCYVLPRAAVASLPAITAAWPHLQLRVGVSDAATWHALVAVLPRLAAPLAAVTLHDALALAGGATGACSVLDVAPLAGACRQLTIVGGGSSVGLAGVAALVRAGRLESVALHGFAAAAAMPLTELAGVASAEFVGCEVPAAALVALAPAAASLTFALHFFVARRRGCARRGVCGARRSAEPRL
jgi:hypothetical protein